MAQYDTCPKTAYLTINTKIKKQAGRLIIPVTRKPAKVYMDDNENFHEFVLLGDIKGTAFSLVKQTDFNSEEFYLVNRSSGAVDTLIGKPVFAENMRDFACINNPGTDEKQQIQICEIKNGSVNTRVFLRVRQDEFLEGIACINKNYLLAMDNKGNYWRLNFKVGDEYCSLKSF